MLLMVNLAPDVTCQFFILFYFFKRLEPIIDTVSIQSKKISLTASVLHLLTY